MQEFPPCFLKHQNYIPQPRISCNDELYWLGHAEYEDE